MERIINFTDKNYEKFNLKHSENTQDLAKIAFYIANDFADQLLRLTNSQLRMLESSDEQHSNVNQRLKDIENIIEMLSEFYTMQAEYIKNNNSDDNKKAPSVCKKAISIMLAFEIDYESIPYEQFRSPYEWLLYISLLVTFPKELKNDIEIVAEYKDKTFNYFNDICILNKFTNNLVVRIECDGKSHYDTEENYERQCIRQNDMMIHDDYKILRYGNRKIYYENFYIAKEIWNFVSKQLQQLNEFYNKEIECAYSYIPKSNILNESQNTIPLSSMKTITTVNERTVPEIQNTITPHTPKETEKIPPLQVAVALGYGFTSMLSFPILILLSILLSIFSMNTYGKSINPNPTGLAATIHTADEKIYNIGSKYIKWFFDAPLKTEIICLLIILTTVIILTSLCKLDVVFQKLPGGRVLKELCDYDFFEFQNHMRLLPAFLFAVYIMIWFGVIIFKENAVFELDHFDWFFKGYTPGQVITQIFAILILCTLFFVLLDSFVSAGFIGGIFQLAFIFSANMLMMILSAFIGTFTVIALAFVVAIAIVLFFLRIIL